MQTIDPVALVAFGVAAVLTVILMATPVFAQAPGAVAGDNQSLAIEPGLSKHVLFDNLRRNGLDPTANRPLRPPDFGQPRRIPVLERAVADQGGGRG